MTKMRVKPRTSSAGKDVNYGIFYNGDDDSLNDIELSQVEPLSSVYILL